MSYAHPLPPPPLTESEAARVLGITPTCLRQWRHRQMGPRYLKVGAAAVRYRLDDLLEFMRPVDPAAKRAA